MDLSVEKAAMRLLEEALALSPQVREAWLRGLDAEPEVARRLRELLEVAGRSGSFLETPAALPAQGSEEVLPASGDRVGAWRIVRELDRGGMGVVYLAHRADGAYEQRAAIKLIRTDRMLDPEQRQALIDRFENERRVLARLEHPNVARVLDGGETALGLPYLAMEFVDGPSLIDHCEENGLDVLKRIELFCRVCAGVQAAHRHLIVHRDLKPQNVLVGPDGEPRLLDFGIARVLENDRAADGEHTQTRFVAMTPAYASPEQLRQDALTTASDIYSLGVILFELLAGIRPYSVDGLTPLQSERVISTGSRSPLRRALLDAPLSDAERRRRMARIGSDLERIVAKAMHPDPERRYGVAQALADDLRRHLDGQPVLAHPDSLRYRIGKFVGRHRLGSAVAGLALAAILATTGIAILQERRVSRTANDLAQVNAFLVDVLNVSNPYVSGSEITLGQALDEAAAKIDERFRDRPDLAAELRLALGQSMIGRHRLEAAEVQLQSALAAATSQFGADDRRSLEALAAVAKLRKYQGRLEESRSVYANVLERVQAGALANGEFHASVLNDIGALHLEAQDFAQAEAYLSRSLLVGDQLPHPPSQEGYAQTLGNLAHAARGMGDLDRADALYQRVQEMFLELYPDGGPYLGIVLNNRARLAHARGQEEQAMQLLTESVEVHRRSFQGDHAMILVPMTNLAFQALELDRIAEAAEAAEAAVAMADREYVETSSYHHVNALAALIQVRLAQRRYQDAAGALDRARRQMDRIESVPDSTVDYVADLRELVCAQRPVAGWPVCTDAW